jgi:hypothetical protein
VTIAYLPAQGAFTGVLRGDQDWLLQVANSSNNPAGVTVYFLDRQQGCLVQSLTGRSQRCGENQAIDTGDSRMQQLMLPMALMGRSRNLTCSPWCRTGKLD